MGTVETMVRERSRAQWEQAWERTTNWKLGGGRTMNWICLISALLKAKNSFRQQTQDKRTVTSRVDCLLETVFQSQGRRKVLEVRGKNSDVGCLQQGTSGRFTTRTEDLCTVQQKVIVQCPLVCSWGC